MNPFEACLQQLQGRQPLPPLLPEKPWDPELSRLIHAADFGQAGSDSDMVDACRAGLLLWNDDLAPAHGICQRLDNPTGSFWHAVLHRREGDAGNSNYWWRLTGDHDAFPLIQAAALSVLQGEPDERGSLFAAKLETAGTWLPPEFVAECAMARTTPATDWLLRVQVTEIETMLAWCRRQLRGSGW